MICMDEKLHQLLGEAREPLLHAPGDNRKVDFEYTQNGTCSIFVFVELLRGVRHVSIWVHRTAINWAEGQN